MPTKVSVFGQEPEIKKLKPIEFKKMINVHGQLVQAPAIPSTYENVQLLYKGDKLDTILAWSQGVEPDIYLGNWNDGFVK